MNEDNVKFINEVMNSWGVQLAIAALLLGLVIVAFSRASRIFADGRTRKTFRIAAVVLGVFVVLQAVATAARGSVPLPPLLVIELLWLSAMWFYYFVRFTTRQRSGPGDAETRRRGAALDSTISRIEQEHAGGETGPASHATASR